MSLCALQAIPEPPQPSTVEGRVIDLKSGETLRRTLIILKRGSEPGIGTYTDGAGNFLFRDVQPGAYTVSAERNGFVEDPEAERTAVHVKAGSGESDITLKLLRTGVISGRVVDADGEPVTGATVQAQILRGKKGAIAGKFWATTNDRGEYRLFHISPGKYHIVIFPKTGLERLPDLKMQARVAQSGDVAEEVYSTTYYPGTLDIRDAVAVQVEPGSDLEGLAVRLRRARAVWVRGTVATSQSGLPGLAIISLKPLGAGGAARGMVMNSPDGKFEFGGVLPGRYVVSVSTPLGKQAPLTGRHVLNVGQSDIDGLRLPLAAPQNLGGWVTVPEGRKLIQGLTIVLVPREEHQSGGMVEVSRDGAFTLENVPPGDYDLTLASMHATDDLYISSIRLGDRDALNEGIHVADAALPTLEIKLKPNGGLIECAVSDSNHKPLPEAHVVLVPDPPRQSQMALQRNCITDADGTCTLSAVTPGAYHAFGFETETDIDLRQPDSLRDIENFGKPIRITEGEKQRTQLQVIPEAK